MKIRLIAFCAAAALVSLAVSVPVGASASSKPASYIVVLKQGKRAAALKAIRSARGRVVRMSKVGVATVTSPNRSFERTLRGSGAVAGIAHDATFVQPAATTAAAPPPGTNTVASEATKCSALYGIPLAVGPDPLSPCQWDMRIIGASPTGSYAVNRGSGVTVGDLDTGIDLSHPDLAPNLDVAASCSFIYASTPTSDPAEQVTPGDCSNKAAVQDLNGHGTHTAGTMAAPINGVGIAGVAPAAKIVALKAGTIEGFFFTQSVVDGLV